LKIGAKMKRFIIGALLGLPLAAGTIVSTDGLGNIGFAWGVDVAGWSQTQTYINVTITAEIDPGLSPGATGTFYLMTQIGPGTTTANQIATTTVTATGPEFNSVLETLFTGLTLGPGNYYLVFGSPNELGWAMAPAGITPVTDTGVTYTLNGIENVGAAYPPATTVPNNFGDIYEFTASGTAVPEPTSLASGAIGLIGLIVARVIGGQK
jgi:hypothetical protein